MTIQELKNILHTEWDLNRVKGAEKLVEDFKPFHPAHIDFNVTEYDDDGNKKHSLYDISVFLTGTEIVVRHDQRDGYSFYMPFTRQRSVNQYEREEAMKGLGEPNRVRKLSASKIKAWLDYLDEAHARLTKLADAFDEKVAAFRKELDEAVNAGASHNKFSDHNGELFSPILRLKYDIGQGYISVRITYDGSHTLAAFKKSL